MEAGAATGKTTGTSGTRGSEVLAAAAVGRGVCRDSSTGFVWTTVSLCGAHRLRLCRSSSGAIGPRPTGQLGTYRPDATAGRAAPSRRRQSSVVQQLGGVIVEGEALRRRSIEEMMNLTLPPVRARDGGCTVETWRRNKMHVRERVPRRRRFRAAHASGHMNRCQEHARLRRLSIERHTVRVAITLTPPFFRVSDARGGAAKRSAHALAERIETTPIQRCARACRLRVPMRSVRCACWSARYRFRAWTRAHFSRLLLRGLCAMEIASAGHRRAHIRARAFGRSRRAVAARRPRVCTTAFGTCSSCCSSR